MDADMNNTPEPQDLPANLRLLRILVTALMAVMILGFLVIVGLFVIRLSGDGVPLPAEITLPEGDSAQAVTYGEGWYGVVTEGGTFLIFGTDGTLRQRVEINAE